MAVNQVIGGSFQDGSGNLLVNGYLTWQLNQDAVTGSGVQVCAGITVTTPLNSSANISTSPAYSIWPNDQLTPANTYYTVFGYNASGQLCWGPNNVQVLSSPSPYNVNAWVPNLLQVFNPNVPSIILTGSAPTTTSGQVGIGNGTAASATTGTNGATPAQVVGYLIINIAGTNYKIPYYNV